MKKFLFTSVLFIHIIFSGFSQSNFKAGYIISNKNDTIYGFIDFRTDHMNTSLCKFKIHENEAAEIYHPGDIAGFRFEEEGKFYVTRTIEIDSLKKTVFLEFLLQGMLNLYYYPEGAGYYFFENSDGTMISITKKEDMTTEEHKVYADVRYKGVLRYVFKDDLPLAAKAKRAEFDHRSMIEFTKEYHDEMCTSADRCIIFENDYKKEFTKYDFTAYTGVELNRLKLNYMNPNVNTYFFSDMYSVSPVIGIEMDISSPQLLKSLSLTFNACGSKIAGGTDYSTTTDTYYQYEFNGTKSEVGIGLKYTYDKGRFRPTLEFGATDCNYFSLKSTYQKTSMDNNQVVETTLLNENTILPRNNSSGYMAGVGIDYQIKNDHFIVVRLIYARQSSDSDNSTTYQLKLGYRF